MKKLIMLLFAVILVFGMVGTASAIPYTDTYDAGHYRMDPWGANSSVAWTFDITEARPGTQMHRKLPHASVTLNFSDDDGGLLVGLIGLNMLNSMLGPIFLIGKLILEMSILRLRR